MKMFAFAIIIVFLTFLKDGVNFPLEVKPHRMGKNPSGCPGEGGALPYKPMQDVPFFRVSFFSINS